jgi:hypothetical protein
MPHPFFAGKKRRLLTEDRPDELREELKRRMKEIDDGTVQMIPGDEFIRALEETARELSRPKT